MLALMPDRPRDLTPPVVLVVDDETAVLQMMSRTLLGADYAVHTASSGQDALTLAEQLESPLDLVVIDIRMEPMRGPELAQLLFSRGLASRFLFVSGYGPAVDYNDKFGPLLAKPFPPERLVDAVAGVLAGVVTTGLAP
jgi:two-component system, cell cycle sensor histidine kinase and response regulator CckA